MRLSTIIIVVAALGVSVLTAFLIQMYLGSQTPSVETKNEIIAAERVLVAKADLAGGTVLKAKDHFRWQAWPADGLSKSYVLKGSDLDKKFVGAVVRREIKAGTPIIGELIYRTGEKGFLASGLKPGMYAVAIKVDPIVGVAGLVTPGDYVDVILSTTISVGWEVEEKEIPRVNESRKVSETILRNIRVLAVNQNADKQGAATKKPKSVTLEVTEKQAEVLANVRRMGKLFLALRSHVQPGEPPQERDHQFTTDLEVLSSLRGGLVAHISEQNNQAMQEFGLQRWLTAPEEKAASAQPTKAPQVRVPLKRKIAVQAPIRKPRAQAPVRSTRRVRSTPVVVTPPVVTSTVRIDRAGNIQTLKFKEAQ